MEVITARGIYLERYTLKKGSRVSRPQPGCHYTKLSLDRNNDVITELFLPGGSLVSDIPAGDGKLVNLFYGVGMGLSIFLLSILVLCRGSIPLSTVFLFWHYLSNRVRCMYKRHCL
jgi:hypothetical protein